MKWILRAVALIALTSMLSACGFEIVDTGHRGVKTRFGEVVSESLPEGLYFYNPLTSHIIEMDVRVQRWNDTTGTYTRDVQQAEIKFTLNYRIDPAKAYYIYKEVGLDWDQKLVPQVVNGVLKEVIGKWDAVDLIANRDKAGRDALAAITGSLATKDVIVSNFNITDIQFTKEFERSVEDKVVAQQRAIEEQNRTAQVEQQAKQKVIQAQAEAQSISIRAQALEKNARLVEWEAVQKWDGKLPQYMLGGGAVPFINVTPPGQK